MAKKNQSLPSNEKLSLKFYLMNTAHLIDVFRVIPRFMVAGYGYLVYETVTWFTTLPEPTSQHTFLISTIVGGAAAVFGLYVNSGTKWDDAKSADPKLYIESSDGGSSFGYDRARSHTAYPQQRYVPQQRPYQQPQHGRYELDMPMRPPQSSISPVSETPPEGFFPED